MREVTLGQIAYEAHFGELAGDYALQSAKQQERWQRSAEAVLSELISIGLSNRIAAAVEREAGLVAMVERLREVVDDATSIQSAHDERCRRDSENAATCSCGYSDIMSKCKAVLKLTPPAALEDLRRREREQLLIELRMSGKFSKKACVYLGALLAAMEGERDD